MDMRNRPRVRRGDHTDPAGRRYAAAALQRALDRRDNGGTPSRTRHDRQDGP